MKIPIAIERSLDIPFPLEKVEPLYDDIESTIRRFPKLKKLTPLAADTWLWEMQPIGSRVAKVSTVISYAAKYHVDHERGVLSWQAVRNKGNASIEGAFEMTGKGRTTKLKFRVRGELHDVPVPLVYRLLAPAFVQGIFARLVDTFLERTHQALLAGTAGRK